MLKLENITKIFNQDDKVNQKIALNNVSFSMEEGEFVTVIGGNGSGKSTLMNIISGLYTPEEGKIFIDNIDVTKMKEHQRAKFLGRVFQDPLMGTAFDMSIEENMSLALRRGKTPTLKWGFNEQNRQLFINKLEDLNLGLEKRLTHKVGLLSGGQRQALTLIMATIKKPKLLLLDEHTAALDPKTAKIVLDLTLSLVKEFNITTLMITHNLRDAIKYGDRLIMLNEGRIILDIKGEEKKNLTITDLLKRFDESSLTNLDDRLLLS
ncbi:TPA: ATP-binding cassette domain-containing protein [bacterium]|jgi:putative ABC transport system ATP-binding protein|nr:ATP-binding cassette domain-containing protein [bacterium]